MQDTPGRHRDFLAELATIENLPTLPVVTRQVMALVGNPRSSMAQIAAVIAKDQAISARVVRLVNSAFYGMREHVGSIQHAIVVLGLNTVKNLMVGVSMIKTFEDKGGTSIFDRNQFWMHTFGCARTARLIAEKTRRPEPEDFFLAGLLHDIGILIQDQFFHSDFTEVLKSVAHDHIDLPDAERAVFGLSHAEVGAVLARRWQIPEGLVNAIRFHHTPDSTEKDACANSDMIAVVHVADAVTLGAGIGNFIENRTPHAQSGALARASIGSDVLDGIVEQVRREIKDLMKEWGL